MNEMRIFQHEEFGKLGLIEIGGKPHFPATKCASILGYSNPHKAIIDHCLEDGLTNREVIDNLGRKQSVKYISEGNLYRLIARAKLPGAERYERWVFDEVLPQIREHGAYMTPEKIEEVLLNPDFIIRLATPRFDTCTQKPLIFEQQMQ